MARVLLVDDNDLNRNMLTRRLERNGFEVIAAVNGRDGVARAASDAPDVILMDLSMPGMDGWTATRHVKADPKTQHIPVIVLTAHAMVGDREKAMAAGCDAYETKPVNLASLLDQIGQFVQPPAVPAPAVAPVGTVPGHTILLVGGNEANCDVLRRRLEREGYRVVCSASGLEALAKIASQKFDLVLLDVMTPEMNGLETLAAVRARHSIAELPVVLVTAKGQSDDVVMAFELGANDYTTRPLDLPVVLARIKAQLAIRDAHAAIRTAPAAAPLPVPAARAMTPASPPQPATLPAGDVSPAGAATLEPPRGQDPRPSRDDDTAFPAHEAGQGTWVDAVTAIDWPHLVGYEILAELGRGGMGVVYKARHLKMDRLVALKVIDKHHLSSPIAIDRFYREIRAAAQLSHPNIVLAYDAGQVGETHFFAMEYVEGIDLSQQVKRSGPLPVGTACNYVRQAARGLNHAFERGLVHRDIKPSNLLVAYPTHATGDGPPLTSGRATLKLLDMGVALLRQSADGTDHGLIRDGRVVGTADYMAPEQWTNPHKVDIRADLYSLGCTFYFLLTGRVPFPSEEPMEKMLKHHLDEPAPVEALRPEVPSRIAAVVRRLMAKTLANRFQQPSDVVEALR